MLWKTPSSKNGSSSSNRYNLISIFRAFNLLQPKSYGFLQSPHVDIQVSDVSTQ